MGNPIAVGLGSTTTIRHLRERRKGDDAHSLIRSRNPYSWWSAPKCRGYRTFCQVVWNRSEIVLSEHKIGSHI